MKFFSPRTPAPEKAAFTLIELLVVISIIAILATLSMGAAKGVMDNARKAAAKNDIGQIVIAITSYYTDYGKYPVSNTSSKVFGGPSGTANSAIVNPLRFVSDPNNLNPRQTRYLQVTLAKDQSNPKSGIDASGNWMDPWGVQYAVFIDADYSNQIDVSTIFPTGVGNGITIVPISCGAASVGYDKIIKKRAQFSPFDKSSDLVSWQ